MAIGADQAMTAFEGIATVRGRAVIGEGRLVGAAESFADHDSDGAAQ
jgi:hypothetical protein